MIKVTNTIKVIKVLYSINAIKMKFFCGWRGKLHFYTLYGVYNFGKGMSGSCQLDKSTSGSPPTKKPEDTNLKPFDT